VSVGVLCLCKCEWEGVCLLQVYALVYIDT